MDALTYLRKKINAYFPDSAELQLGGKLATQRRFNFYFKINQGQRYLLYLNWDGEEDRFTLKCLEFADTELLSSLIAAYPESGSKVFNAGKPRSLVSFEYTAEGQLSALQFQGIVNEELQTAVTGAEQILRAIDPFYTTVSH